MNPLVREDTEAPVAGDVGGAVAVVVPHPSTTAVSSDDEQRAAALWRRLLGYRHTHPNSRLGLLPINQLFDSFLTVLAEPARFGSITSSTTGEAASLLSAPILPGGLKSLNLTATGGLAQDTVGEVLSRDIADLLLLVPPTIGTTFETAYLEHTVVSPAEIIARKRAIVAVSQFMADCLCVFNIRAKLKVFLFGSVGLATVLPGGDNDVTLVLESSVSPQSRMRRSDPWVPESPPSGSFDSFLQARTPDSSNPTLDFLEIAKDFILNRVAEQNTVFAQRGEMEGGPRQAVSVRGEVINATVPLLKLEYQDGITPGHQHIDISLDQMGGRTSMIFVHRVDERIGQDHLFRRSLLLVKHYCSTVLRVLGAQAGGLGSYTVTVMLMGVFNGLPEKVLKEGVLEESADGTSQRVPLTPLKILIMFLDYYAHFDFDAYVVTIFGPLPVTAVQLTNYENTEAARGAHQQWVAINEIESTVSGNSSPHPPSNLSGSSPSGGLLPSSSAAAAGAPIPGKTSDFHTSPNSNFNPQGEMHKANGFNIFGRSFREGTPASPLHPNLSSPSAGAMSGPVSGRSSEAGGGGAISVIDAVSLGGSKAALDSSAAQGGGDCCPGSVLSALESAPGVAHPSGPNHYSQQCIDEDFVDEYVQSLSAEDVDLAFAQKIFFFPKVRAGKQHHHGGEMQQQQSVAAVASSSSPLAPKAIAASLFKVRMMNIRDPLRPFSNLTPGVQRSSLVRIQAGFAKGVAALRATIHSVCFTDVDGTKYNPERVLRFVAKELELEKQKPSDHTPIFHGIPLNVGVVTSVYTTKVAPNKLPDEPADGVAAAPSPSDEKACNHRNIEDMTVVLASHLYTLLPPAVTDAQQFWGAIIPYVKQPTSSATIEAVSPAFLADDATPGDGGKQQSSKKKIFSIFNMSNDDIRKPISEFQAASAQDSQKMANQYHHLHAQHHHNHHSHSHSQHAPHQQQQHHNTNGSQQQHHQQQQQQHHQQQQQQSGHHHVSSHSQQQQHQQHQQQQQGGGGNNNNSSNNNGGLNNGGNLGRRQSNQASYSHGSPAPESLHAPPSGGPHQGMDPRDISRPTSQHSSNVNFRGSPSYGKSSTKQPGNPEAPPLPPRTLSGTGQPSPSTAPQQQQSSAPTPPLPRSHNPYMPNQPILIPPTANVPQQTAPPPITTSSTTTAAAGGGGGGDAAGTAASSSPPASSGRGRGGRGGSRGRGIQ